MDPRRCKRWPLLSLAYPLLMIDRHGVAKFDFFIQVINILCPKLTGASTAGRERTHLFLLCVCEAGGKSESAKHLFLAPPFPLA